ncbi:glycosyltransferase family 4 protein [Brachybacterium sp. YJGR34]|uniref:glycosyltransferase family 4 protein n=1 Tax=Brachybacterium sp. YJGR34 TaxID=2059911 RepID=UPI000E0A2455|nr:glycosyltransferase family 4 protein [Brachybacterium sp. YJGR34]
MKLLHATTVPSTLNFLRTQPAHLAAHGIEVVVLSSPGEELERFAATEEVRAIAVPMHRGFSVRADLATLRRLVTILRRERPDILHAHTPKAGLLVTLAGRLAGVPLCIYQIHGLRFLTTHGLQRRILKLTERVSTASAHRVLCVSPSVLALAEEEHVIARGKGAVLGSGTINGVDLEAFDPAAFGEKGRALRAELGIAPGAPVIGFVGRLAADKGVADLARAWARVRTARPDAHLVLVGSTEENDPVDPGAMSQLEQDPRVHLLGFRGDIRACYAAFSVLVLPSAREGFPQTLLEGSAMRVPVVGSDVPGVRDAVVDGVTGALVPLHDDRALANGLIELLSDPLRLAAMGEAGRQRALREFDRSVVRALHLAFYQDAAAQRGIDLPAVSLPDPGVARAS